MKSINDLFKNFKKKPVVFIGSGISKRYLGTPTWENLLKMVIKEYNNSPSHYGYLMQKFNQNLELVASEIEKEYVEYFYNNIVSNISHKLYSL